MVAERRRGPEHGIEAGASLFSGLPVEALLSAALERADSTGAGHAEARLEHVRTQYLSLRDGQLETSVDDVDLGLGLRVIHEGSIGFAATAELHVDAASQLGDDALSMARASAGSLAVPVVLAASRRPGAFAGQASTSSTR